MHAPAACSWIPYLAENVNGCFSETGQRCEFEHGLIREQTSFFPQGKTIAPPPFAVHDLSGLSQLKRQKANGTDPAPVDVARFSVTDFDVRISGGQTG